jgi:hypothetical protein
MRLRIGLFLVLVILLTAVCAQAYPEMPRQYYTPWKKHATKSYYWRYYYYKPTAKAADYSYHYAIYYPSRGKKIYYYNPHKKVYWGAYDVEAKGYSLLAMEDRREHLDDIPDKAFPKPGRLPPIPDSEDGEALAVPSDDLPQPPG